MLKWNVGRFGHGQFGLGHFGLGRFGLGRFGPAFFQSRTFRTTTFLGSMTIRKSDKISQFSHLFNLKICHTVI